MRDTPGFQSRSDLYELEILDGLGALCSNELRRLVGDQGSLLHVNQPDSLIFEYSGDPSALANLRTAVAVFRLLYFKVPRPQGVIQGGHALKLFESIDAIRARAPFNSFRIGAAGSDSPAFEKIKRVITQRSGLRHDHADGELVIRFRRSRLKAFGWDVLLRLSPLPLSARTWRKENLPGALNATIAAAILQLLEIKYSDSVLNIMCGSGTFLAEQAAQGLSVPAMGIDISKNHLRMSRVNLEGVDPQPYLLQADARRLPFSDGSFSVLVSDLPWGRRIGNSDELAALYSEALSEAARICVAGGKFAVITQENALFDRALQAQHAKWSTLSTLRVRQADYRPKIYILSRR